MVQPHDLVALLHQERRVDKLSNLHQTIVSFRNEFEEISDLGSLYHEYKFNEPNCKKVKLLKPQDLLQVSTVLPLDDKGIEYVTQFF